MQDTLDGLKVLETALHHVCDLLPLTFATGDVSTLLRSFSPTVGVQVTPDGVHVQTFFHGEVVVLACLRDSLIMHIASPEVIQPDHLHGNEALSVEPHVSGAVKWQSMFVPAGRAVCVPPHF